MNSQQLYEEIYQSRHSDSYFLPVPETQNQIKYKSKCSYVVPEGFDDIYNEEFYIPNDYISGPVSDLYFNENSIKAKVTADIVSSKNVINENLKIKHIYNLIIALSNIKPVDYDRIFGIIQCSDIVKFERKYGRKYIFYVDFVETILKNQREVPDTVGGIDPFYSWKSYYLLRAGEKINKIELKLSDHPDSETTLYFDGIPLENVERHQKFYDYFVWGYWNNSQWKYDELHTLEWYIYSNWRDNVCEVGIYGHKTPRKLPIINIFQTCNHNQFMHYIDLEKNQFHIYKYPDYIAFDKDKFHEDIRNAVLE